MSIYFDQFDPTRSILVTVKANGTVHMSANGGDNLVILTPSQLPYLISELALALARSITETPPEPPTASAPARP